jgi:hypothetical protein
MSQTQIDLTTLLLLTTGLIAVGAWIAIKRRATPEKREKRRRLHLHETGRLGEALVDDVGENLLYYSYSIRGVQYTASQDVSALRQQLPEDLNRLIGPSGMKYATNNPGNSILLCEEWTGLRAPAAPRNSAAQTSGA